jgi:hypothetical protein
LYSDILCIQPIPQGCKILLNEKNSAAFIFWAMSETMSGSKLDSLSLISWSTLKVALLCFQTRKEGKSNFTVVGGWKWKQQFQSGVSQLRMLRLDVEPKVGQSFLPESCSHCPI